MPKRGTRVSAPASFFTITYVIGTKKDEPPIYTCPVCKASGGRELTNRHGQCYEAQREAHLDRVNPRCQKCGKRHRGYSDLSFLECKRCCSEVGQSNLHYVGNSGGLCNECYRIHTIEEEERKKRDAVPGLVEVDGGYAYRTRVKDLSVGDVVLVPATWLDKIKGRHDPKEATVTSLSSCYTGETSCILGVLRKANN
jgi:hypothetical protein